MVLHNSLRLYSSQDTFVIEPVYNDPSVVTENVVIHRATGEVRLNAPAGRISPDEEVMTIYGIMGFIRLLAGEYMVVITDRTRVGRIVDHDIFKLKDYKILPVARNNLALSDTQTGEESAYLSLLHSHLQSGEFHFSYTYDFTHTLQRQSLLRGSTRPIWERADERFFWNYRLQSKFIEHTRRNKDQDLSNFILPVVNGFVEIKAAEVNKKPFTFALVSRRSRHRAGTRYFSRGVDQQGNVSNFNETEQIVVVGGSPQGATNFVPTTRTVFSHVQTRGSIPIFWAQINNIKYTPKLQVFDDPETENAFRRHFEAQKKCYGPQLVVNLVNKKGYEGPMGAAFSKQIDVLNDPQIKYYHFDFHHECSKMRWNRVSLVLDYFHHDLIAQRYYKAELGADGSFRVLQRQASVMRTNCMDCLDRTNVVQSVVSRWVLNRQLQEVGILAPNELFETSEQFEPLFRTVWADNADVVSCAYSGTGALKTDFTRTGRRTKAGAFQDFQNSAVRYVKNNFMDGSRQDAYDLFLGYDVHEAGSFPLADTRPVLLKMIPLVLFVCFAMVTISLILPETLFSTSVAFFIVFWIAVAVYVIRFILANGMFYVNWPRLVPLGYDIPLSQYSKVQVEPKLGGAEVELGWKNE